MNLQALPEFWARFNRLPPRVQEVDRKNLALWQQDTTLKSLAFKAARIAGMQQRRIRG